MLKTIKRKFVAMATLAVMAISVLCGGVYTVKAVNADTAPVLTTAKAAVRLIKEEQRDTIDGIRFMNQMSVADYQKLLENDTVTVAALFAPYEKLGGASLQLTDIDNDGKLGGATVGHIILLEKTNGEITQNYFEKRVDQETQEEYYGAFAYVNEFPFAQADEESDEDYQTRLTKIYRFGIACRSYYQIDDNDPVYSLNEYNEERPAVRSMEKVAHLAIKSGDYEGTEMEDTLQGYLTEYTVSYTLNGRPDTLQAYEKVTYGEQTTKNDFVPTVPAGYKFVGWKTHVLPLTITNDVVLVAETESLFKERVIDMNNADFLPIFQQKGQGVTSVELVENVEGLEGAAFKFTLPHNEVGNSIHSSGFGIKSELLAMMKELGYVGIQILIYNPDFVSTNGGVYSFLGGALHLNWTNKRMGIYTLEEWETLSFNRAFAEDNTIYVQLFAQWSITDKGDTLDLLQGYYMCALFSMHDVGGIHSSLAYSYEELANGYKGNCFAYVAGKVYEDGSMGAYLMITSSGLKAIKAAGYTKLTISVYSEARIYDGSQNKFHVGWSGTLPTDKTVELDLATILADSKYEDGVKIKIHNQTIKNLWITQMTATK